MSQLKEVVLKDRNSLVSESVLVNGENIYKDNIITINDVPQKPDTSCNHLNEEEIMEICVNRIIAEGLFKSGYGNAKEILDDEGNPIYLEIVVNGHLTEVGEKRLRDYVASESNNEKELRDELDAFLNSLPDDQSLCANPIVCFWDED